MDKQKFEDVMKLLRNLNERIEANCAGGLTPILEFTTNGNDFKFSLCGYELSSSVDDPELILEDIPKLEAYLVSCINQHILELRDFGEI